MATVTIQENKIPEKDLRGKPNLHRPGAILESRFICGPKCASRKIGVLFAPTPYPNKFAKRRLLKDEFL
jgi:hypothetical protein